MKLKIDHIIPASGKASRLSGIPKFLLPIPDKKNLLSFHLSLSQNIDVIRNVNLTTNSTYFETIKNLHDLKAYKKIKNIEILNTNTMNQTINKFRNHDSEYILLSMPDTYFTDHNIVKKMIDQMNRNQDYDCILGLWNIKKSQRKKVGQCKIEKNKVIEVVDKNPKYNYKYLWGVVLFRKTLWEFIDSNDPHIGYSFNPAIKSGLNIGYTKATGSYYDCGTIDEYWDMVKEIKF
jgi:NDP-sugar pyrophosphorylase family protein